MTSDQICPIADFRKLLSDSKIDLSPIELAEILWLAVQRSERIIPEERSSETPEPLIEPSIEPSKISGQPPIQPSEISSGAEPDIKADIVVEPPKPQEDSQKATMPLPIKIPEAVALRNRREISKSLRPLMRKVPSRYRQIIDEEATAIQISEDKIWNPVVKPEPERWLELAIVIEVTNLFDVWKDTIDEFRHLMERHGAFRDVRTWQLQTSGTSKPQLFLQTSTGLNRKPRSLKELLDAGGRRLVLFLSDCTSGAWRSGEIFQLLQLWSRENPVTIGQLLPEHYWDRSALSLGTLVALRSPLAGALSRDWLLEGLSSRRRQRLQGGIRLPVVTLQPRPLDWWAKALAAGGEQQTTGIVLKLEAFQVAETVSSDPIGIVGDAHPTSTETLTAKQLVQRFRGTASEKAQELADMMAVLPVNWSVLRLLQKNLAQKSSDSLQEPVALHLAEIFLSGLLCPVTKEQKPGRSPQYDFISGVRSVLLGTIPISEAQSVGEEIAKEVFQQLPSEVQERVNTDIKRRWGESFRYFEAFLLPDLPWGEDATAEMLPFAQVTGDVLRRWGGEYAELAEELEQTSILSTSAEKESDVSAREDDPPPPEIEWFTEEIEVVSISLHNFNFDVFLGYNTADKPQVKIIAKKLEERGLRVWLDEEQLALGESFQDTIQKGISQSKVVAIFIGSISLGQWQISELQVIIDQFVDQFVDSRCRRCRVIPVLLPRVEKIPDSLLFLQSLNWVRFENIDDGLALGKLAKGITGIIDFTENLGTGITLEMVAIPEGNFMMGAPKNEKDSYDDERPQHEVSVPTFLMGKYQITQAQWKAVAGLPQIEKELNPDPSRLKGDNRPVGRVSWLEAVEFCKRLSEHTKREYRLPSEAEWEYACRAGTTTAYYFGNDVAELENYAWYNKNSEGETHPVGEKLPNGFGLHDMHGNVWEWCADDWHDSYKNAPSDGRAWIDNDNRSQSEDGRKLLRGGSSITFARNCRSACRYDLEARPQDDYFGFRVVCVLQ